MKYDLGQKKNQRHRFKLNFLFPVILNRFFLCFLAVGTLITILFLSLSKFKATEISCRLENEPCSNELVISLQRLKGQPLFFSDFETDLKNNFNNQPFQLSRIQKKLPNQLIIHFTSLEPAYNLELTDKKITVDLEGHIIEQEISNLSSIQVSDKCPLLNQEQKIDPSIHDQMLVMLQLLKGKSISPEKIVCHSSNLMIIKIKSDLPQFLLNPSDLGQQTQKLIILLGSLQLDTFNPSIQEIDLRFNQPVLREVPTQ